MLLNEFFKTYNENNGWFGPYEQENGYLTLFKTNRIPRISGGKTYPREYVYFEIFNCGYCRQNAIRQIRSQISVVCSRNSSCYNKFSMDSRTKGGIAHTRNNPTTNYFGYLSWKEYKLDSNGNKISRPLKNGNKQGNERRAVFEHRIVMEEHLGRKLQSWEIVHHIDMDKLNNNFDNLWLCNDSNHKKAHCSFEKLCVAAMYKPVQFGFNKKTGKYYLK